MAGKYDEMSFKKAFSTARKEKGSGKKFTWKGKSYSTNTKEDEEKNKKSSKKTAVKTSLRPKARSKSGSAVKTSLRPKARAATKAKPTRKDMTETVDKLKKTSRTTSNREADTKPRRKPTRKDMTATVDKARRSSNSAKRARDYEPMTKRVADTSNLTYAQYKKMTRPQRRAAGLPDYVLSEAMFKRNVLGKRNNFFKKVLRKKADK